MDILTAFIISLATLALGFGVISVISASIDDRSRGWGYVVMACGLAGLAWAWGITPGGMPMTDIPRAFFEVYAWWVR